MDRILDTARQTFDRVTAYGWLPVLLEIAVIWGVLWLVWRFVRGTRAAGAIKGVLVLAILALALRLIAPAGVFERLAFFYDKALAFTALALVIIFQPELRRGMVRLGEAPFLRSHSTEVEGVVDALVAACAFLSKSKFGAIIAIEQRVGLREIAERGRTLDAVVSAQLLQCIFWPNSPLHDMGVVVRGDRVLAAGVQFPLADPRDMHDPRLGTRHRAAVGLARATDAVVLVVSEETGAVRIAQHGELSAWLPLDELRKTLRARLGRAAAEAAAEAVTDSSAQQQGAPQ